jgi:hypothetical protein
MSVWSIREMSPVDRRAMLESLASNLECYAECAGCEGNEALEIVMMSVASAIHAVSADIAVNDIFLAEDVAAKAVSLLTTFYSLYPDYQNGQTLH